MSKRVQYQTADGVVLTTTDHPTYTTRKRAAKITKELGHSTLYEIHAAPKRRYDLSHYIQ
ncbi:hypothetical protein [Pontibacter sp. H249]|uniref:hypothetical protein n=1 Tax=Pontibacter sp. H249 TaxID=3133420 RepID=UPI0030BF1CAC